jgi:adenosine deaminase
MVEIALDGVEATWLDDTGKRELRARVERDAVELTAQLDQA